MRDYMRFSAQFFVSKMHHRSNSPTRLQQPCTHGSTTAIPATIGLHCSRAVGITGSHAAIIFLHECPHHQRTDLKMYYGVPEDTYDWAVSQGVILRPRDSFLVLFFPRCGLRPLLGTGHVVHGHQHESQFVKVNLAVFVSVTIFQKRAFALF